MQSELEFVRERFAIVKEQRQRIDRLMIDAPHKVDRWEMIIIRREYRLLGKILAEVHEGCVLKALQQWREKHCQKLQVHKLRTRGAQNAADKYWRMPAMEREAAGKPPKNPSIGIKIKDAHGEIWVIDDRYIMMMDRIIEQLQRWLAFEG
jgi:hypothetical protein